MNKNTLVAKIADATFETLQDKAEVNPAKIAIGIGVVVASTALQTAVQYATKAAIAKALKKQKEKEQEAIINADIVDVDPSDEESDK